MPKTNRVRYELFKHFGYFVTESSEHFAEYVPWFIKRDRPDLIKQFNIPLDEYISRCEKQIKNWDKQEQTLLSGGKIKVKRSHEYAARIMASELTNEATVINGNVANHGYIENLPEGACVEVPCLVDHNGIQPTRVGRLPVQPRGPDADQHQRAGIDGRGHRDRPPRSCQASCHDGPAHGGRTLHAGDRRSR